MKNFDNFLNENSAEMTLLSNLYSLHEKKNSLYKFKDQVQYLESQGQLSIKNINKFLSDKNIKIDFKESNKVILESECGSSYGGCGSSYSPSSYGGCGSSEPEYYLENDEHTIHLRSKEELKEVVKQFNLKKRRYSPNVYILPDSLRIIVDIINFIDILRDSGKYNL
jgi:hypothetical protein